VQRSGINHHLLFAIDASGENRNYLNSVILNMRSYTLTPMCLHQQAIGFIVVTASAY
jgi:hypothetical protein